MRIQRVGLEYHRDIAVLGLYVVAELAVDVQLTVGDVLQTGDHAESSGLTAAGRTDQYDKFLILNVKVNVVNSCYTAVVDLFDSF